MFTKYRTADLRPFHLLVTIDGSNTRSNEWASRQECCCTMLLHETFPCSCVWICRRLCSHFSFLVLTFSSVSSFTSSQPRSSNNWVSITGLFNFVLARHVCQRTDTCRPQNNCVCWPYRIFNLLCFKFSFVNTRILTNTMASDPEDSTPLTPKSAINHDPELVPFTSPSQPASIRPIWMLSSNLLLGLPSGR